MKSAPTRLRSKAPLLETLGYVAGGTVALVADYGAGELLFCPVPEEEVEPFFAIRGALDAETIATTFQTLENHRRLSRARRP